MSKFNDNDSLIIEIRRSLIEKKSIYDGMLDLDESSDRESVHANTPVTVRGRETVQPSYQ